MSESESNKERIWWDDLNPWIKYSIYTFAAIFILMFLAFVQFKVLKTNQNITSGF